MELDLDALQELPAAEEQAGACKYTCTISMNCPATCETSNN